MTPAEHALSLLEAARDLRRNVRAAILSGRTEGGTTVGTVGAPSVTERHYSVTYYQKGKRGTWIARFATVEEAERFAVGKVCWGRPAFVKVESGAMPEVR